LNNCIIYFNTGPNYDSECTLNYCCTTPPPTNGVGNISLDPQIASASHLSSVSPCRGAGNAAYASGTDIDGESWANPPSVGCDEYQAGAVTGPLSVGIIASFTNVSIRFESQLAGWIEGRVTADSWDFGDGTTSTNQPYTSHAWAQPGDYTVVLRAYNESWPGGISTTATVHVVSGVHYVAADSANPVAPYTSWATAARNIEDAIYAAIEPGAQVLVTNGIYAPISLNAPILANWVLPVRSVNGPLFTIINGGHSNRCVYLVGGTLSGFTLTNGFSASGGGAICSTLDNCILTGNSASNGGGAYECTMKNCTLTGNWAFDEGGGVYGGTLNSCAISGNSCAYNGGGAIYSKLNNCTLTSNSAYYGGGAYSCTLNNSTLSANSAKCGGGLDGFSAVNNSIVYFNTALGATNYNSESTLSFSCTTPQPTDGLGNITNAPLFVNTNGWANLRLESNSPCINAGNNVYAVGSTDLDGNTRVNGGVVDIGAYEFQSPTSLISYAWLQQYGLPIDGSADFADPDADGLNNWQEWRCGTDPTNALSALRLLGQSEGGTNVMVTWQSVAGVSYFLQRRINLGVSSAFTMLATRIPGQPVTTTFIDTNAPRAGSWFYRVGVGN
jgi:hypothetical protein